MLQLPFPPGTVRLKNFWFAVSLLTGLSMGVFCQIVFALNWILVSGLVAMAWFLPGFFWPQIALIPYRVFNKLSRVFSQQATVLLVSVCFALISVAVGRQASALRSTSPQELHSLWQATRSVTISDQSIGNGISFLKTPHQSWATNFLRWALHSGNWWMCALLPFLFLIAVFGKEPDTPVVPSSVYTLY